MATQHGAPSSGMIELKGLSLIFAKLLQSAADTLHIYITLPPRLTTCISILNYEFNGNMDIFVQFGLGRRTVFGLKLAFSAKQRSAKYYSYSLSANGLKRHIYICIFSYRLLQTTLYIFATLSIPRFHKCKKTKKQNKTIPALMFVQGDSPLLMSHHHDHLCI